MIDIDKVEFNKSSDGLIPAIVQDAVSLNVLMLGYMNRESVLKTIEERRVCFYSRSKKRLWTKGESSGNFLTVVDLSLDCDRDTLLIKVNPNGPVCHNGTYSCFCEKDSKGFIRVLEGVIEERRVAPSTNSYTSKLLNGDIGRVAKKVGEEASEVIIEAVTNNRERAIYEIGDLVYHTLVLMNKLEISIDDIEKELIVRHK
jgi:phosphoribosyl-ATP pyrophosphohydrolase/phosphoribosyl-AMP cyclohydrolase